MSVLENPPNHPDFHRNANFGTWQPRLGTNIIEEGHVAYVRVHHMLNTEGWYLDRDRLWRFYAGLAGFGHLIIDVRGNPGGFVWYFDEVVAQPLIPPGSGLFAYFHHFYIGGAYNLAFMEAGRRWARGREPFDPQDPGRHFTRNHLTPEVIQDIGQKDYRFVEMHRVLALPSDYRSPFDGKIWMLVDGGMFSASQMVAAFYKDAGFATLVGETTGGMVPTPWGSNFFALPNTGIIIRYDPTFVTDRHGRPLEYGTTPHYFNRPGMDALETVLAMIEERALRDE